MSKLIKVESSAEYIDLYSINIKDGAQFDTGLTGNADYRMILDFIPRVYSGGCILGQDSSDGDNNDFRFFNFQRQIYYDIGSARLHGSSCNIGIRYKFEFGNYYVKNYGSSGNILSGSTQTFTSNYPVVVQGESGGITFYSLDIYLGNDKIREYVPKKRISDGEIGIYDNINNTFVTRTDGYGTVEAGLNIIPVGSPTITDNLITGFSSSNYATPTVKFPSNAKNLEIQVRFKTPSSLPEWYGAFGGEAFALYLASGKVRVLMSSDNEQWDIAGHQTTVDCSTNAWHIVKLTYDGSVYKYFLDGALIYSKSSNLTLKGNSDVAIGGWLYNGTTNCLDTASGTVVDLQYTYIKVNGDYYWWTYPSNPKPHYKLIKVESSITPYEDITIYGSPTRDGNLITSFSSNNYAEATTRFPSNVTNLEVQVRFKTPSSIPTWYGIFGGYAFAVYVDDGNIYAMLSSDSSTWDIAYDKTSFRPTGNTWYTAKLKYDGSTYKYYMNDSLIFSKNSNLTLKANQHIGIGGWMDGNGTIKDPASGTVIDLSETFIKVDGEYYWWAYPSASKANYKLIKASNNNYKVIIPAS